MRRIDISGRKFFRLTAISSETRPRSGNRVSTWWFCKCDCSSEKWILGDALRSGNTKSCGCLNAEKINQRNTTHGKYRTRTYNTWSNMLTRCSNEKSLGFDDYGGRGITVCEQWLKFENFLADMGERPAGLTLDRIKNELGYSKENCRWATSSGQARNRRTNFLVTIDQKTKPLIVWCEDHEMPYQLVWGRLKKHWSPLAALTTPVRSQK